MKIEFSPSLYQAIENCLTSAGDFGRRLLVDIDWQSCSFDLIEIPGLNLTELVDYSKHVVPHTQGSGTYEAPDNYACLASRIKVQGSSLVTRDFALGRPHKLIPPERVLRHEEAVYYVFDASADDDERLLKVIALATSWVFLGMTFSPSAHHLSASDFLAPREWLLTIVLSVCSGDTYVEVSNLRWKSI